jgi:outer membrane protein assembly factor BamB
MHAIWTFATIAPIQSTPAVDAGGRLFLGSSDNMLRAINPDGNVVWSAPIPISSPLASSLLSSPALSTDSKFVYIGSSGDSMWAFNTTNGSVAWVFTIDSGIRIGTWKSSPVVSASGAVFAAFVDNFIYALNGTTGDLLWRFSKHAAIDGSGVIGANGELYIFDYFELLAINSSTGTLLWSFAPPVNIRRDTSISPAVGDDNVVFISTYDDTLYALDGTSGSLIWSYSIGSETIIAPLHSSPSVSRNGLVVVASNDMSVNGFDAMTGAARWKYFVNSPVYGSALIDARGVVYFLTTGGLLLALDGSSGELVWNYPLALASQFHTSIPVLAQQPNGTVMLYISGGDGYLYALRGDCEPPFIAEYRIETCRCLPGAQSVDYYSCSPCPPGTYNAVPDYPAVCAPCPAGTYSEAGSSSCLPVHSVKNTNWIVVGPIFAFCTVLVISVVFW